MSRQRKVNTRALILKTAGRLFSRRGYFGVSMQDIANELSITKAALYYHFKSKESLTEELLMDTTDDLKKALNKACNTGVLPSTKIFNMVDTLLDFRINHPELSLLVTLGYVSDEKDPMIQFVQNLRIYLTKSIRVLIGGINFTRKITYSWVFFMSTSLLGLVLNPFQTKFNRKNKNRFTAILLAETLKKTNRRGELILPHTI